MLTRFASIALFLMLAARPARAQQTALGAPPAQNGGGAPSEVGVGVSQVLVGALATAAAEVVVAFIAAGADSAPIAVVGFSAAPSAGGLAVCGLGPTRYHDGGCAPSVLGGYLGAIGLGIPMTYLGANALAPATQDGHDRTTGAILGAALGVAIGTAVGATIGWHLSKRPRERTAALAFGAPVPPPAALASWSDLQARTTATRATTAVGVPLLSLRF
jgi:hypothetical protein